MNLLQIITAVCQRTGLPTPTSVVSSADDQLLQLLGLVGEVCEDLTRRHTWTDLTQEAVFTSVAGSDQGLVTSKAKVGFLKILNETIYDRTQGFPIYGPRSPQEWQAIQALPLSGPFYQYRIRLGRLLITPDIPAAHTLAFEYASEACFYNSSTDSYKVYPTADDDEFLLNKTLLILGLRWRWREEKGLPYAENFRAYETAVAEAMGADGTKAKLSLDGGSWAARPGIVVPAGNWNLP